MLVFTAPEIHHEIEICHLLSKAKIVAIMLTSQPLPVSGMPEHPTQVKVTNGLQLVLCWFWGLSSAFYLWLFQVILCYSNIVLILTKITQNRGFNWKQWVIASYMYELDNKSMIQGALKKYYLYLGNSTRHVFCSPSVSL